MQKKQVYLKMGEWREHMKVITDLLTISQILTSRRKRSSLKIRCWERQREELKKKLLVLH